MIRNAAALRFFDLTCDFHSHLALDIVLLSKKSGPTLWTPRKPSPARESFMSSPYLLSPLSHAEGGCIWDRTFPSGSGQSNEKIMAIAAIPVPTIHPKPHSSNPSFHQARGKRKYLIIPSLRTFPIIAAEQRPVNTYINTKTQNNMGQSEPKPKPCYSDQKPRETGTIPAGKQNTGSLRRTASVVGKTVKKKQKIAIQRPALPNLLAPYRPRTQDPLFLDTSDQWPGVTMIFRAPRYRPAG